MEHADLDSRPSTHISVSKQEVAQLSARVVPSSNLVPISTNNASHPSDGALGCFSNEIKTVLTERTNITTSPNDLNRATNAFTSTQKSSILLGVLSSSEESRENAPPASRFPSTVKGLPPRFPTSRQPLSDPPLAKNSHPFVPQHINGSKNIGQARTVSLPSVLDRSILSRSQQAGPSLRSNHRIVSLPEVSLIPGQLSMSLKPVHSKMPTEHEHLLIDLSSPQQNLPKLIDNQSPTGTVLIHSSFDSSGSQTISSMDSSDSEESICMGPGSPIVGRSSAFLRNAPYLDPVEENNVSSAKARSARLAAEQEDGWISMSPQPIPALHGPPSLPYARCPSGAEGILVSEQSSLPRVVWGLDGHTVNSGSLASARSPRTPNVHIDPGLLPSQSFKGQMVDPSSTPYPAYSAFPTPASTVVATPSSVIDMSSESPNKDSPGLVKPIEPTRLSDNGEKFLPHASPGRHIRKTSGSVQVKGLGSPLHLGGYTEYHYEESPEWEEFIPSSATDVSSLKSLATASFPSTEMLSQDAGQLPIDIHVSRPPSMSTVVPIQNDPSAPDLPAITEMIDNPATIATATPEMWSLALRKFWTDAFIQLEVQQRSLLTQAALVQSGVLTPGFTILPGTSLSSITPLLPSQPVLSEKHEPYTGAINNPRSVPMQRLRRKLATVKEEKENEGDIPRNDLSSERSNRVHTDSKLQTETQSVLNLTQEEAPRVKISQKTSLAPGRSTQPSSGNTRVSSSKQSMDPKKKRGDGRSVDLSSSAGSNGSGRPNASRYAKGSIVQRVKESNRSNGIPSPATKAGDTATRDGKKRKTRFGPPLATTS